MASFNKTKLYASFPTAEHSKNYTQEELLALNESKPSDGLNFIEPSKKETKIIGEFVETEGKLLLDTEIQKKKNRSKKSEEDDS